MTTSEFATTEKITATVAYASSNPNMADSRDMNHFRVTLHRGRRRLTVPFSQGFGITGEPTAASVLDCLASDAASVENAPDFENWAADLGYDTDSRTAERTFRIVEQQAAKLRRFLGDDAYDTLLWHTERD